MNGTHILKFLVCILFYFYTMACQGRCMGVHTAVNTEESQQPNACEQRIG